MSIQATKSKIHHLVDEVEDETLLAKVSQILSGGTSETLNDFIDEQLAGLEEAREEIKNGKYSTKAEHKQKIEQLLSARG